MSEFETPAVCPCGHEWREHSKRDGCHYGWEYDGPDPAIASADGCYCALSHADQSPETYS